MNSSLSPSEKEGRKRERERERERDETAVTNGIWEMKIFSFRKRKKKKPQNGASVKNGGRKKPFLLAFAAKKPAFFSETENVFPLYDLRIPESFYFSAGAVTFFFLPRPLSLRSVRRTRREEIKTSSINPRYGRVRCASC